MANFILLFCFLLEYKIFANSINQKSNILSTPNPQLSSSSQKSIHTSQTTSSTKLNSDSNEAESILPIIPSVLGVTRYFYCLKDDNCQKIVEFSLADNYSFNCYELFLPIEYNLIHLNRKYPAYGFISSSDYEIKETQKYGSYCKKISRYLIFYFRFFSLFFYWN